ncbi:MAG: TRAM domain-containing protein, partial [Candidatus Diapherotrites archaeon]|nr:TRAM domain-containing protein [Candidatus Diapherotrites archaeon]
IAETKPDALHISRFQSRVGTTASQMRQLQGGLVKDRSRTLAKLRDTVMLENNKSWVGRKCKVLVDEKGLNPGETIAHNLSYKQVVIKEELELGQFLNVKIVDAGTFHLLGKLV